VAVRGLHKTYPGVMALRGVSLSLFPGEVHMLLGENGAGKSTLVKILAGAVKPDPGSEFRMAGQPIEIQSPRHSRDLGISVIHQELNLIPNLSAAQNMALGREQRGRFGQLEHGAMRAHARRALHKLGVELNVDCPVEQLSVAQQQLVEIGAALLDECRVLILDEPTSALAQHEVEKLGEVLGLLKADGVAILYITHRFEEVFEFGDRATIFRDGEVVGECLLAEADRSKLIQLMVGRDVSKVFPSRNVSIGETLLEVRGLSSESGISNVSFRVHAGEVLALAGLMGSGRTEVARALFGADQAAEGTVTLCGKPLVLGSVQRSVAAGLALVPEDRKYEGLVLALSVGKNVTLAGLRKNRGKLGQILGPDEASAVAELSKKLSIKAYSSAQLAGTLSGGNQQKVVIAKWLHTGARVFILDEPTRGIDVGAKQEIYNLMNQLLSQGAGIIMISSELPEVLGMADRIIVMCEGRVSGELAREQATPDRFLELATAFSQPVADAVPEAVPA
jgi:ABC-type sugar transport system ATPase subunit